MARLKPNSPISGRTAWMAAAWLTGIFTATGDPGAVDLSLREQSRRHVAVEEAQMLLRKGDEAYLAGRYAEALEAYAGAREMIPDAPVSAELSKQPPSAMLRHPSNRPRGARAHFPGRARPTSAGRLDPGRRSGEVRLSARRVVAPSNSTAAARQPDPLFDECRRAAVSRQAS